MDTTTTPGTQTDPGTEHYRRLLRRCPHERMLAGVAAGLADYLDVDPTVVRIGLVLLAIIGGIAVPLYLAAWLLIPEEEIEQSIAEQLFHRWKG
jgi:phage shock protein PspC (stress-responsive transcriptional regulator)